VLADAIPSRLLGRFDVVLGNPPYRRELGAKASLDRIAATGLGRRFRSPRMDLWYYFFHRGLELLRAGGRLSFLVSSYWTGGRGAEKLIQSLREAGHVEEIFLLGRSKLFAGVAGQHLILTFQKGKPAGRTTIKRARPAESDPAAPASRRLVPAVVFRKPSGQLFCGGHLDLEPPAEEMLARLARWPPLGGLGTIRQGIVENPAAINAGTNRRHANRWRVGEGVFALRPEEVDRLPLTEPERLLLRPYHDLCDLGRYYVARRPSLWLLYATKETWSREGQHPVLRDHLSRFRAIMEARRETRLGVRTWWQLHWPRDEALWPRAKIAALQMAPRPAFAYGPGPLYVPFSANILVPGENAREDPHYLVALLNSRLMWSWFRRRAKRRGADLEINGHVLAQTPIRTIDFADPAERATHARLVELARQMAAIERHLRATAPAGRAGLLGRRAKIDRQIDEIVYALYGLTGSDVAAVETDGPALG
jgi:adenine-specific DNA-methyltransferase